MVLEERIRLFKKLYALIFVLDHLNSFVKMS